MKHPDYDRAFHETPEYIRSAIELGFVKGKKAMKMRYKITSALSIAAAMAVILGAAAFGASRLGAPRPDGTLPGRPLSGPAATAAPVKFEETEEPAPTVAPTLSAPSLENATPEPTPMPIPTEHPQEAEEAMEPEVEMAMELETVYYTEGGRFFHAEPDCSGLENALESSLQAAFLLGKEPCPICLTDWQFEVRAVPADGKYADVSEITPMPTMYAVMLDENEEYVEVVTAGEEESSQTIISVAGSPEAEEELLFYYTEHGIYYHSIQDCSGMVGADIHALSEAIASGKRHCPVCIGDDADFYMLPVPVEDTDRVFLFDDVDCYHIDPECTYPAKGSCSTLGEAEALGLTPCPKCLHELTVPNSASD